LLRILAVRIRARGLRPLSGGRPLMLVANHVSWLDIHVLHALLPVRFVAKADMLHWPLLGWLAQAAGTLFVNRAKRHDASRINHQIGDALLAGDCVGVFPEGTTTFGDELKHFHGSLLQPAVQHAALLCPVSLRYLGPGGGVDRAVSYVGEATLLQSVFGVLSRPSIRVRVAFLPPIDGAGLHRRELARRAEFAIARNLNLHDAHKVLE
jgi:1-acyl-sn-glycerol-3-phosphate acyltransferase